MFEPDIDRLVELYSDDPNDNDTDSEDSTELDIAFGWDNDAPTISPQPLQLPRSELPIQLNTSDKAAKAAEYRAAIASAQKKTPATRGQKKSRKKKDRAALVEARPIETYSPIPRSIEELSEVEQEVFRYLAQWCIEYDYKTDSYTSGGNALQYSVLRDYLVLYTDYGPTKCLAALDSWTRERRRMQRYKLHDKLNTYDAYRLEGNKLLTRWMQLICRDGADLSAQVMRHWIWCVKRKLAGLEVVEALIPVFQGKTRSGKTTEVRRLLAPIEALTAEATVAQIQDERHYQLLTKNYVLFLDEFAKADHACIETLKTIVTSKTIQQRVFHTTRHETLPMNASFIGTSNNPIAEVIKDPTSGARYWEVRCKDRLPWAELAQLDLYKIWGCVSADEDPPLSGDWRDKIQELQHAKLRDIPPSELWLQEFEIAAGEHFVSHAEVYHHYSRWCDRNRHKAGPSNSFGQALRRLGLTAARSTTVARTRGWLLEGPLDFTA